MTSVVLSRIVGIALLVMAPLSTAESVLGVLRDGVVHHESAAAAATHRHSGPQSGHGREDAAPTHEHGSPADHCTHVHGTATVSRVFSLSFGTSVRAQRLTNPAVHASPIPREDLDPPRA